MGTIPLGRSSPDGSSDQPGPEGGQPWSFSDLAPEGVCLADPITRAAGALLPHPFKVTGDCSPLARRTSTRRMGAARSEAPHGGDPDDVLASFSLLHFPPAHADRALPGLLPCGAPTFLPHWTLRSAAGGPLGA